jgi:transcriptional regulator with XRE-family HTH domain
MQKSSYAQERKDPKREFEIGQRLREFRESQMIPRTRLAVAVNIGNERLASYETGRAPLPYTIFSRMMRRFGLNAVWLATGESQPTIPPFDDTEILKSLPRRARFSQVYDRHLKRKMQSKSFDATQKVNQLAAEILELANMPPSFWKNVSPAVREEFRAAIEGVLAQAPASSGEKARAKKD